MENTNITFRRKSFIIIFLVIYLSSFLLNVFYYAPIDQVDAHQPEENNNLVPVFVDEEVYNDQEGNIEWYANQYIQNVVTDSKALVYPINVDNFQAKDIYKMLENLYLEGQKNEGSRVKGTVLIGDIPLPVVRKEDYVYPTVYPYVNFENRKFSYSDESGFFEYTGQRNSTPDIWHGVINFEDMNSYGEYFDKLVEYAHNPEEFVDQKIWYDDFINLGEYLNTDEIKYYLNNFVFFEDIINQNFTNIMVDIVRGDYEQQLEDAVDDFAGDDHDFGDVPEQIEDETQQIEEGLEQVGEVLDDDSMDDAMDQDTDHIPTKLLWQSIEEMVFEYHDLLNDNYLTALRDNVQATGRWDEFDSHIGKVSEQDQLVRDVLGSYEGELERALDDVLEENDLYMEIPVLTKIEEIEREIENRDVSNWNTGAVYENYYYGKPASKIFTGDYFNIFRGTYGNYETENITGNTYSDFDDENNIYSSIGSSYSMFETQVEANRGFNFMKGEDDGEEYEDTRWDEEDIVGSSEWAARRWGGATPMNIDMDEDDEDPEPDELAYFDHDEAWNPYWDRSIGGPVYDIAGSKKVSEEEEGEDSYIGYQDYSSLIKIEDGEINYPYGSWEYEHEYKYIDEDEGYSSKTIRDYEDFFDIYEEFEEPDDGVRYEIKVEDQQANENTEVYEEEDCVDWSWSEGPGRTCSDEGYTERNYYYYNLVDTRVRNNSPTSEQIEEMNLSTKHRPIDTTSYITFKGLDGEKQEFEYPSIFDVELYEEIEDDTLELKSLEEIEDNLEDYLREKATTYNQELEDMVEEADSYYEENDEAFDFLEEVSSRAKPDSDASDLISEDYFVEKIGGEDGISRIAHNLYYINQGWDRREYSENVLEDIDLMKRDYDMDSKIQHVTSKYLDRDYMEKYDTKGDDELLGDDYFNPSYNQTGYEVGIINSEGTDTVRSEELPDVVGDIQDSQNQIIDDDATDDDATDEDDEEDEEECPDVAEIRERPDALNCWWNEQKDKTMEVQLTDKCAMGSLNYILDEDDVASTLKNMGVGCEYIEGATNECDDEDDESGGSPNDPGDGMLCELAEDEDIDFLPNVVNIVDNINSGIKEDAGEQGVETIEEIENNIDISLEPDSAIHLENFLDTPDTDLSDEYYLDIDSDENIGPVDITAYGFGDNSLHIKGQPIDSCDTMYEDEGNYHNNNGEWSVEIENKEAGEFIVLFEICKGGSCFIETKIIDIVPATIDEVEIDFPVDKVIDGGKVPFIINAYDAFDNDLGVIMEDYVISPNMGEISRGGDRAREVRFNDFSGQNFVYHSPDLSEVAPDQHSEEVHLDLQPAPEFREQEEYDYLPEDDNEIEVVEGNMDVEGTPYSDEKIEFELSREDDFGSGFYEDQLTYELHLEDMEGESLETFVEINSREGKLKPGQYQGADFEEKNEFLLKDGVLEFQLYPNFDAGEDELEISIPGMEEKIIDVEVSSGEVAYLDLVLDSYSSKTEDTVEGTVYARDVRDNVSGLDDDVELGVIGNASFNNDTSTESVELEDGRADFEINTEEPGGMVYLLATIPGKELGEDYAGDYESLEVESIAWFEEGMNMNVMYMNLFGTDWGNQWGYFSEHNKFVNQLMEDSDKMLSATTELVDPDKIKPFDYIVGEDLNIKNFAGLDSYLDIIDGELNIIIGGETRIGEISIGSVDDYNFASTAGIGNASSNVINYIPEETDSVIHSNELDGNQIYINGNVYVDFGNDFIHEDIEIKKSSSYGREWDVVFDGQKAGTLQLKRDDDYVLDEDIVSLEVGKNKKEVFAEGSTNGNKGVGIYDVGKEFSSNAGYDSIQHSDELENNIGFRNNFSNVTDFANENSVGQATKHFASDFVVNFGDPLLKRIDDSDIIQNTKYDGGPGKRIYTDEDDNIEKVLEMDFDNSGKKDLAVVYRNGTIRLLKNYGGSDPYVDMGDLMVIADGIKDIYAGDATGNGFEDIMVWTNEDQLRVYENEYGQFDVNGQQVCLDVPGGPDTLDGVNQLFVENMEDEIGDDNKTLDIVTNDEDGQVKIFYGGSYISEDRYSCDDNWDDRIEQKEVEDFSLLLTDEKVYDSSKIRRDGLEGPEDDGTDLGGAPQQEDPITPEEMYGDGFDDSLKYRPFSSDFSPVYEEHEENEEVDYAEVQYVKKDEDDIEVYKEYENITGDDTLDKDDEVEVTVTIESERDGRLTYLEDIQGPWNILRDETDGQIVGFNPGNLNLDIETEWTGVAPYQFKIDNIRLEEGETYSFSYNVYFAGAEMSSIDVEDVDDSNYRDIKIYPTDACMGMYEVYFSQQGDSYESELVNLNEKVEEYMDEQQEDIDDMYDDIEDMQEAAEDEDQNPMDNAPDQINDMIDEIGSTDFWKDGATSSHQIDYPADISMDDMVDGFDGFMDGLCEGFDLGDDECGVPMPINAAFLAPGYYQSFVCQPAEDPGVPFFWFPGTLNVPCTGCCGPIPFPWMGTTSGPPVEEGAPTGCSGPAYNSFIRLYAAPTLTQQAGFAACFGSYDAGMNIPQPASSVSGNCIVAASPVDCDEDDIDDDASDGETPSDSSLEDWQHELANMGQCEQEPIPQDNDRQSKPFGKIKAADYAADSGSPRDAMDSLGAFDGEYFGGFIEFDTSPSGLSTSDMPDITSAEAAEMRAGSEFELEIQQGDVKGLIDCIIEKWADKQIRYFINNLSMNIDVYLPDFEGMFDGFEEVGEFTEIWGDLQEGTDEDFEEKVEDQETLEQLESAFEAKGETYSNPFRAIAQAFEEVNIIDIHTRQITIQYPMYTQDELESQIDYFEGWVERNQDIIEEWEDMYDAITGTDEDDEDAPELDEYLDVVIDARALISDVRENKENFYEWKNFPFELYEWISVFDRYLDEITCIIETLMDAILGRLEENAQRFEERVDLLILLIGIVRSWQILIDFSVDWQKDCEECTVDTYDFHSCALDVMCVDLPVLPIPPFRLPNIEIDLSNIEIGIDVVLPEFQFRPIQAPRISLPDLPAPPRVAGEFNIPGIPVIPEPPELPELPSLMPTIEMELPTLPPAPEVPNVLPQIEAIIDLAEIIGELLCIIKGNIGLVAEGNVKTRIEQLTQRPYNVDWFDDFNVTIPDFALDGNDLRIESFLQIQYDFDDFYESIEGFFDDYNQEMNEAWDFEDVEIERKHVIEQVPGIDESMAEDFQEWTEEWEGQTYNELPESQQESLDSRLDNWDERAEEQGREDVEREDAEDFLEEEILDEDDFFGFDSLENYNNQEEHVDTVAHNQDDTNSPNSEAYKDNNLGEKDTKALDYEEGGSITGDTLEYETAYSKLMDQLQAMINTDEDTQETTNEAKDTMNMLERDYNVSPNKSGVKNMGEKAIEYIEERRGEYQELQEKIKNDFDSLVKPDGEYEMTSFGGGEEVSFATNLFDADHGLIEKLNSYPHPNKAMMDMNQQQIDGYKEALENNTPSDLNMSNYEYQSTINKLNSLQQESQQIRGSLGEDDFEDEEQLPMAPAGGGGGQGMDMDIDLSQYVEGYFVEGEDEAYHNVVNWEKGDKIRENKTSFHSDINENGKEDIVLWDEDNIYIKYGEQETEHDTMGSDDSESYIFDTIDSPQELQEDRVDEDGFISLNGKQFKLRGDMVSVDNFEVIGQSTDELTLAWDNMGADAYAVKLTERVDVFYDNRDGWEEKNILVTEEGFDVNSSRLDIYDVLDEDFVYDHLVDEDLHKVVEKDMEATVIRIDLENIERKWKYFKVAPLSMGDTAPDAPVYQKVGPWSYQDVGAHQIWADTSGPDLDVSLHRKRKTEEIPMDNTTNQIDGYINTYYDLVFDLETEGEIIDYNLTYKDQDQLFDFEHQEEYEAGEDYSSDYDGLGESIYLDKDDEAPDVEGSYPGKNIVIQDLYIQEEKDFMYNLKLSDHAGNIVNQNIKLNINTPELEVTDVFSEDNLYSRVGGSLSNDIDNGYIGFERNRFGEWETLEFQSMEDVPDDRSEQMLQEITTDDKEVDSGIFELSTLIELRNENDELIGTIDTETTNISIEGGYHLEVSFRNNTPVLDVIESSTMETLYNIEVGAHSLQDVSLTSGNYSKVKEGGKTCITEDDENCVLVVNNNGEVYSPSPYNNEIYGEYKDLENGQIGYDIYNNNKEKIGTVEFMPSSFNK